jgi:predicted permease
MRVFHRRADEDFDREIDAHLTIEIDRLIGEGMTPDEARHAAARRFGNGTKVRERFYESRRILWLEELRQDIRYGWRGLRRSPGFATVAILTLALGIGANTAIFGVVNAALLRPLPYRDPGSLVLIQPGGGGRSPGWVVGAWRDRAVTIDALAGFNGPRASTLVVDGEPGEIDSAEVTWDFLSFLGVAPTIGRDFTSADAAGGAPAVALLSHDLWRARFGADPAVIGRPITVSGSPMTIVGVTGPAFRFPAAGALPAFGLPLDTQPDLIHVLPAVAGPRGPRDLSVIGRLRPNVTAGEASRELLQMYRQAAAAVMDDGEPEFSASYVAGLTLLVESLQAQLAGSVPARLRLVMGAVAFVLLIACANVANLLLARASTRQRELALRAALGARRGRLARLVLTESLLLALLGSVGALLVAYSMRGVVRVLLADRLPHVASIAIDWPVLVFNAGVAVVTGILCGLASLEGVRRVNPAAAFGESRSYGATGRSLRHRVLLASEVAGTFVLLVGAALLAQTLWNLSARDRGFDADRVLTMRVNAPPPPNLDRRQPRTAATYFSTFFSDLVPRLQQVPGVVSAGAVSLAPLSGIGAGLGGVSVDGRQGSPETFTPVTYVSPGYFSTMRTPVIAGRDFDDGDRLGADLVAIVNEAFERRYAPDGPIIGARVTSQSGGEVFTIVGVTRDVPDRSLRQVPEPLLVAPLAQMPAIHISWSALTFVLRTNDEEPLRLVPAVRRAIWSIDPNIVVHEATTMDQRVAIALRAERDSALLFGLFALAALVMAAIGVYGVAAYAVAQRTQEIGIRVALGAAHADVRRLVASQTLWPTLGGIVLGVGGAALLTRLVASMVYGVTPLDPTTFGAAVLILMGVALAATWAPSRRAMRIDPVVAIRES